MWSIVKEEVELTEMLNESKSRLLHKRTELEAAEKRHNDVGLSRHLLRLHGYCLA